MAWILVAVLLSANGHAVSQQRYETREACEQARQSIDSFTSSAPATRAFVTCTPAQ